MDRRGFLKTSAFAALTAAAASQSAPAAANAPRKRLAAISSTYHVRSHSDNIITRFLEGYWINDKYHPSPCDIVTLYVEQEHPADVGSRLAASWGVRKCSTIHEALTLDGKELAVDGVVIVGEHGDYSTNGKNQLLYPRHRFMADTVKVFRNSGRSVPVFNDKHLSYDWAQAKQMYDWSKELGFPLMAGSSVSVTFRRPELDFPLDTPLEEVVAVGGGWVGDGGLFHILEVMQCFAERRKGGETGVKSVQLLTDEAVWKAADEGRWSRKLLEAALSRGQNVTSGSVDIVVKRPVACLVEYNDGFRASALAMGGKTGDYLAAVKIRGQAESQSTLCYIPSENSNNFSPLVDSIQRLMILGTHDYPVERTLLTSGALSFLMESWYEDQKRIETPALNIRYRAPEKSYYAHGQGS